MNIHKKSWVYMFNRNMQWNKHTFQTIITPVRYQRCPEHIVYKTRFKIKTFIEFQSTNNKFICNIKPFKSIDHNDELSFSNFNKSLSIDIKF